MASEPSIFEKTYKDYISQIAAIDLKSIEDRLGIQVEGNEATIPLFGKPHRVSRKGIIDPWGKQPSFDICVILCKYLLLCPDDYPIEKEWVAYRDLKDSGPLTSYFLNDVERAMAMHFSGRPGELVEASNALGGCTPDMRLSYEVSMQFYALPQVPLLMLFSDSDEEFPAKCSVLFERRADKYLDPECLAMVGRLLFTCLTTA